MSLDTPSSDYLLARLDEIAHTLHEIGLSTERPTDDALASTAPFCLIRLNFTLG